MKIESSTMLSLGDNKSISKKGEGCKIDFLEVIGNTLGNQLYDYDINNNKVEEGYEDSIDEALDKEKDVNDKLSEAIMSLLNNINMSQDKNDNLILSSQASKSDLVDTVEQDIKSSLDLLFIKNNINIEINDNTSNKTEEVLFNEVNEEKINLDLDNDLVKDKFKDLLSNTNIIDTLKEMNEKIDSISYEDKLNILKEFDVIDDKLVKGNLKDGLSNKDIVNLIKEIGVVEDKALEKLLANNNVNNVNDTLLESLNPKLKNVNKENNINDVNLSKDGIEAINENLDKIVHEDIIKQVINRNSKLNLEGLIDKIKLTNNVNEIKNNLTDKNDEVLFNEFNFIGKDKFNLALDNAEDILSNIESLESLKTINNKLLEMFLIKTNTNNDNTEKNINNIVLNRDTFEANGEKIDNLSEKYILKEVINKDSKLSLEGLLNEIKLISNEKDNDLLNKKEKNLFNEINIVEEEKVNLTLDNTSSNDNFEDIFDMSFTNKEYVSKKIKVKDKVENDIFSEYENSNNIARNNSINQNKLELSEEELLNTGIRKEYIKEDFIKTINYIKNNDIEELDVKMNPKDLGEISIKFLKNETNEKIIITLENEEVLKLLNENIDEIQTHLYNKEIVGKSVSIEINNDSIGYFSDDLERNLNKNNTKEDKKNKKNIIKNDIEDSSLEKDDNEINLLI